MRPALKSQKLRTLKQNGGGSFNNRSTAAGGGGKTPPGTGCASAAGKNITRAQRISYNINQRRKFSTISFNPSQELRHELINLAMYTFSIFYCQSSQLHKNEVTTKASNLRTSMRGLNGIICNTSGFGKTGASSSVVDGGRALEKSGFTPAPGY